MQLTSQVFWCIKWNQQDFFFFIPVFNLMTFQNILSLNTSGRWNRSDILIFVTPIKRFSQKLLDICIFVFMSCTGIQAWYFVIFIVITSLNNLINFLSFVAKGAYLCYVFFLITVHFYGFDISTHATVNISFLFLRSAWWWLCISRNR
jgi:hypothetical protein